MVGGERQNERGSECVEDDRKNEWFNTFRFAYRRPPQKRLSFIIVLCFMLRYCDRRFLFSAFNKISSVGPLSKSAKIFRPVYTFASVSAALMVEKKLYNG